MLLLHLLSATFTGSEFDALYRNIIETVQKGGEANASAGRYTRVEAACRMCVILQWMGAARRTD